MADDEIEITSTETAFSLLFPCDVDRVMDEAIEFIFNKTVQQETAAPAATEEKISICLEKITAYAQSLPLSRVWIET